MGLAKSVTFLMTLGGVGVGMGVGNRPWLLGTLIYEGVKLERGEGWFFSFFFLSFHHENVRFENICIFLCPFSTQ
jgi:hypothetical protein